MRGPAALLGLLATAGLAAPAAAPYPVVRPGLRLAFPADHGAHPAFRTEWWYVTGWLRTADGRDLGFQVTFFRVRPPIAAGNPSRFAADQILFAHAALSDARSGQLRHGERSARAGFGLAGARVGDADVAIRDWRLRRLPDGRWGTQVATREFALDLRFRPTQPPLAQGIGGYSRKGRDPASASYYYSVPHLTVTGTATAAAGGRRGHGGGVAGPGMVLQLPRARRAGLGLDRAQPRRRFRADGVPDPAQGRRHGVERRLAASAGWPDHGPRAERRRLRPLRTWRSPATGAVYPVAQELSIRTAAGVRRWRLMPLFAAQELDARRGGLPVYWEGAVRTTGGRGYLELTGYDRALRM